LQYVAVVRTLALLLTFVAALAATARSSPGSATKLCGGNIELHPVLKFSSEGCHLA
jgi:hypothetical protein